MANSPPDTVLLAGHLLDGTGVASLADVEVRIVGGRIASCRKSEGLPQDRTCRVIDLRQYWVMPGLIDAHLHLWGLEPGDATPAGFETRLARARQQARDLLHAGFTTVRDLGSPITPWIRDSSSTNPSTVPRILAAHVGLTGARGPWLIPQPSWWEARVVRGVDSAREAVRRLHDEGVDVVKIGASTGPRDEGFGDTPTLTVNEIRAVCEAAHGLGLPVAAHAIGSEAVRRCVAAGVDTIEHGYGLSHAVCDLVAASSAWIVPTLRTRAVRAAPAAQATARVQFDTLRRGVAAGIRYAVGTDSVGDSHTPHGPGNALEIELLGRVLTPEAALAAGTREAARMLGVDGETGTLTVGRCADLIAVPGDPRRDLSVLQRVAFVMRNGQVVRSDPTGAKS
ncbi:MAG: amidohydrolase family protein [Chloroflexota bacterium]|nr:amidohydrolase family protein [Chloroflexota bacterium]MDE2919715.1 amidohydrolase family protein [Chloroflexota bacterium]